MDFKDRKKILNLKSKVEISSIEKLFQKQTKLHLPTSIDQNNADNRFRIVDLLLKFMLVFKIFGILPCNTKWRILNVISRLYILSILFCLSCQTLMYILDLFSKSKTSSSPDEIAFNSWIPMYFLFGLFNYILLLMRKQQLDQIVKCMKKSFKTLENLHSDPMDRNISIYVKFLIILFTLLFISIYVVEEAYLYFLKSEEKLDTLENYMNQSHGALIPYLPFEFNPVFPVFLFFFNILPGISMILIDLLIITLSCAIYMKFKSLYLKTVEKIENENQLDFFTIKYANAPEFWRKVRRDHLRIFQLLGLVEKFLSPIIFASYFKNIYTICVCILEILSPYSKEKNLADSILSGAYFLEIFLRIILVSMSAWKINDYSHMITLAIQTCPERQYSPELERLERLCKNSPIGLNGLGCFTITRSFLLGIGSVIFTIEIVLVQSSYGCSYQDKLTR